MLKVCIYFAYAEDREFTVQSVCKAFRKSKVIALFPSNESLKRYVSFVCIASSCLSSTTLEAQAASLCSNSNAMNLCFVLQFLLLNR